MDLRSLLPHVLLLFGVGFLIANLLVVWDLIRYLRRRQRALLTWPGPRPPYYGLILFLGVTLGVLLIVKVGLRQWAPRQLFGEGMMFVYYAYAIPLTRRIGRGFYEDGIWADNGFMQYTKIGRVAWRESGSVTLLLVSNERQLARSLTVPIPFYGEARRVLRDKIAAHDIQFSDGGLNLGRDALEDV